MPTAANNKPLPNTVPMTSPAGEVMAVLVHTAGEGLPRIPRVYFDGSQWQPIPDIAEWQQQADTRGGAKTWTLATKKSWRRKMRQAEAARLEAENSAMREALAAKAGAAIEEAAETAPLMPDLSDDPAPAPAPTKLVERLNQLDVGQDRLDVGLDRVSTSVNGVLSQLNGVDMGVAGVAAGIDQMMRRLDLLTATIDHRLFDIEQQLAEIIKLWKD